MKDTRVIFIHIPKTAGRSILAVLNSLLNPKHKTISDYCREIGEDNVRNCFKFACVRNPWDRAVSCWAFFGNMGFDRIEFGDWLKQMARMKNRPPTRKFMLDQMSYCRSPSGDVLMNSFLRFEQLDTDWKPIAKQFSLPERLPRIGVHDRQARIRLREMMLRSKRPELAPMVPSENYRDMYTSQETIDCVAGLDAETVKRFGYSFP